MVVQTRSGRSGARARHAGSTARARGFVARLRRQHIEDTTTREQAEHPGPQEAGRQLHVPQYRMDMQHADLRPGPSKRQEFSGKC